MTVNADTAIVTNNYFFHYCHPSKTFLVLQLYREGCPLCNQKNPVYVRSSLLHTVVDMVSKDVIMTFMDSNDAIDFLQKHYEKPWALSTTGLVTSTDPFNGIKFAHRTKAEIIT